MTRQFTCDDARFFHDGHRQYGDDVYRLAAWALAESERAERLAAELTEARADLAAERGEADGALPGWRAHVFGWTHDDVGTIERGGDGAWEWFVGPKDDPDRTDASGEAPTARAAMRAAEAEASRLGLLVDEMSCDRCGVVPCVCGLHPSEAHHG